MKKKEIDVSNQYKNLEIIKFINPEFIESKPEKGFDRDFKYLFNCNSNFRSPNPLIMVTDVDGLKSELRIRFSKYKNKDFFNKYNIKIGMTSNLNEVIKCNLNLNHVLDLTNDIILEIFTLKKINQNMIGELYFVVNGIEIKDESYRCKVQIWRTEEIDVKIIKVHHSTLNNITHKDRIEELKKHANITWRQAGLKLIFSEETAYYNGKGFELTENGSLGLKIPMQKEFIKFCKNKIINNCVMVFFIENLIDDYSSAFVIGKSFGLEVLDKNYFESVTADFNMIIIEHRCKHDTLAHELGHYIGGLFNTSKPSLAHHYSAQRDLISKRDDDNIMASCKHLIKKRAGSIVFKQAVRLRNKKITQ